MFSFHPSFFNSRSCVSFKSVSLWPPVNPIFVPIPPKLLFSLPVCKAGWVGGTFTAAGEWGGMLCECVICGYNVFTWKSMCLKFVCVCVCCYLNEWAIVCSASSLHGSPKGKTLVTSIVWGGTSKGNWYMGVEVGGVGRNAVLVLEWVGVMG